MGEEANKFKENLDTFEAFGQNLQAKGNDIVRDVQHAKKIMTVYEKLKNDLNRAAFDSWLASANTSAVMVQPHIFKVDPHINLIHTMVSTAVSSGSTLLFSLTAGPIDNKEALKDLSSFREQLAQELDSYLRKFGNTHLSMQDLVAMRLGAWKAFHSPLSASLLQAAHTMRDILSKIVTQLAPNHKVEKASWYKPHSTKKLPTEHDRLRYLLYGLNEELKEPVLKMLSLPLDVLHEKYNRLKGVAHGSGTDKTEVESCMIATEDLMLAIFKAQELVALD